MKAFMKFQVHTVADAIREFGYKAKVHEMDSGFFIESAAGGLIFYMYCWPEATGSKDIDAELYLIRFRGGWYELVDFNENEIDALCNWYNANQPFTKLYRRNNESSFDLILEADLYILDGMSMSAFESRFNRFIMQFEYAKRWFLQCNSISKGEILDRHNKAVELVHGIAPDVDSAVSLYRHNSHLGYAGSQNNFGDLFENGSGVPKDDLMAVYWYTRASERGEPTAYLSLAGKLAEASENIDSLTIAAKYAILASEKLPDGKNKMSAVQIRDALKEILDPAVFEFAQALADSFKPIYEEKWVMSDSPGPTVFASAGSSLIN